MYAVAAGRCWICEGPSAVAGPTAGASLCAASACRAAYALLERRGQLCRACRRPLGPAALAAGVCDEPACRRADLEQRAGAGLRADLERLQDRAAAELGSWAMSAAPLVVVPATVTPLTPIPRSRRRALVAHLRGAIERAFAPPDPDARPDPLAAPVPRLDATPLPVLDAVLGHACGLCRGWCCRAGRNHAFVTADTIRRYREQHPEQTPRAILRAYTRRLPAESVAGACLFQGPAGCTLPRAWRSDTCNTFFCRELRDFARDHQGDEAPRGLFAAVTEDDVVVRAALLEPDAEPQGVPT